MLKIFVLIMLLIVSGCSEQGQAQDNAISSVSTPQVYTASPQTTAAPIIEVITTPQTSLSEVEETVASTIVTTVPVTVVVTTYPVTTTTTTTAPTLESTSSDVSGSTEVSTTTTTTTTMDPLLSLLTTSSFNFNLEGDIYDITMPVITTPYITTTPTNTTSPLVTSSTTTTTPYEFTPIYTNVTDKGYEAFLEINELRKKSGLSEYILEEHLCIAANLRAREIAEQFSHVRLDYTSFTTVLDEYGYTYESAAESLGAGYSNAHSMVYAWQRNGKEAQKIFDNTYGFTKIGVGYYYYAGKSYWVMLVIEEK